MRRLETSLKPFLKDIGNRPVAVGLSGGPDSTALAHALAVNHVGPVHAYIVDHALRTESGEEAEAVQKTLVGWEMAHVTCEVLQWDHTDSITSGIQDKARNARYQLLGDACQAQGIEHLFLGHHGDDQRETFFFRLAKGSGPDGLTSMTPISKRGDLTIIRPFLEHTKEDLLAYCAQQNLDFVEDPSNEDTRHARVRFRAIADTLEAEGFTTERIIRTTKRLARTRDAINFYVDQAWKDCVQIGPPLKISVSALRAMPEEIALRLILRAIQEVRSAGDDDYGVRLHKVEELILPLLSAHSSTRLTLGGLVISLDQSGYLSFVAEKDWK